MHFSWHRGLTLLLLAAAACGAGGKPGATVDIGADGTISYGSGGTGSGDPNNPSGPIIKPSTPGPGDPVASACTGETQGAQEVQVDMFVMLDRSTSMQQQTGAGPSKWEAVRQALSDFVGDPQSQGLGVALQYFPLGVPGVPETCNSDSDCGDGGRCGSKACLPSAFDSTIHTCYSDADCPDTSGGCVPFGTCSTDASFACFDLGAGGCETRGDCVPYVGGCSNFASCTISDYAQPAVPLEMLPDNADALIASLADVSPRGNTPTSPALSGALRFAADQARSTPDHRVIVVLATDGVPTECFGPSVRSPADAIAEAIVVAGQGLAGIPSILTYVIGVFAPDDVSSIGNLHQLAAAGGTDQAFLIDESQDVAEQLLRALASIRSGSLACEYALPESPEGQELDFNSVNVQLTTSDEKTRDLYYVANLGRCSKAKLGWFYDTEPSQGGTPTKIRVCPATCDTLRAIKDATIEIRLGCATLAPS